jgi:CheY-like chemotaxis protein
MIQVVVADAGVGFASQENGAEPSAHGYGLFSIRSRLDLIGGKLEIKSAPGSGAWCAITAPFAKVEAEPSPDLKALRTSISRPKPRGGMLRAGHKIRVLVADEQALMRQGLVRLLQGYRDIHVVGEAADGKEILEAARRHGPDIIILDANMTHWNGAEITACLKQECPQGRVIGLSAGDALAQNEAMCNAGAFAILNKSNRLEALIATIRSAVAGAA